MENNVVNENSPRRWRIRAEGARMPALVIALQRCQFSFDHDEFSLNAQIQGRLALLVSGAAGRLSVPERSRGYLSRKLAVVGYVDFQGTWKTRPL